MTDVIAMKSPPSSFRALLWKEWRQQRMTTLILLPLPLILFAVIFLGAPSETRDLGLLVGLTVALMAPIILGANAFCGEVDDRSAEFRVALPSRGLTEFVVKLLIVFSASLVIAALLWEVSSTLLKAFPDKMKTVTMSRSGKAEYHTIFHFQMLLGVLLILQLSIIPALISAWVRRTLPCVFASIAAGVILIGWGIGIAASMDAIGDSFIGIPIPAALASIPLVLLVMSPAMWIWSRRERRTRSKVLMAALTMFLLVIVPTLPALADFAATMYFAGPENLSSECRVSPNGKWALVGSSFRTLNGYYSPKAGIANIDTGKGEWLSLTHAAYAKGWSPGGTKAGWIKAGVVWPVRTTEHSTPTYWIFDAEKGTSERIEKYCQGWQTPKIDPDRERWPFFEGWMDDDTVIMDLQDKCAFLNLKTGKIYECRWPGKDYPRHPACTSKRGFFCYSGATEGTIGFSRFAPDISGPEEIRVGTLGRVTFGDLKVSRDGKWLAFLDEGDRSSRRLYVAAAENGAAATMVYEEPLQRPPSGPGDRIFFEFLPNNELVFPTLAGKIHLYSADEQKASVIEIPPQGSAPEQEGSLYSPNNGMAISPSGRFAEIFINPGIRGGMPFYMVVNLQDGTTSVPALPHDFYGRLVWINDEQLLLDYPQGRQKIIVNRDGSVVRPLFADGKEQGS